MGRDLDLPPQKPHLIFRKAVRENRMDLLNLIKNGTDSSLCKVQPTSRSVPLKLLNWEPRVFRRPLFIWKFWIPFFFPLSTMMLPISLLCFGGYFMFATQPVAPRRLRLCLVHMVKTLTFSFSEFPFSQTLCPSNSNWLVSEMQFLCPQILWDCQSSGGLSASSLLGYFLHPRDPPKPT